MLKIKRNNKFNRNFISNEIKFEAKSIFVEQIHPKQIIPSFHIFPILLQCAVKEDDDQDDDETDNDDIKL